MHKIEQLHKGDLTELLVFLNTSFTGDPDSHRFEEILPKMWVDDDEHMQKHYVIREDKKIIASVGIYPFDIDILGKRFKFATVGNMATAPQARQKGCMTALYTNANRILDEMNIDVARLGGKRSRYARFGYEPCGYKFRFDMQLSNALEYLNNHHSPNLTIKTISSHDHSSLEEIRRLYKKNGVTADRGNTMDLYLTLIFSKNIPYGAFLGDRLIGYFTIAGNQICEACADTPQLLANMLCHACTMQQQNLSIYLPPDKPEDLKALADFCEGMAPEVSSHYKIRNWSDITDAFLKLKAERIAPLTDGELVLEIKGHCSLLIKVQDGMGYCEKTQLPAHLSLTELEASRFLFGVLPPYTSAALPREQSAFIAANFPLPFYTYAHDKA